MDSYCEVTPLETVLDPLEEIQLGAAAAAARAEERGAATRRAAAAAAGVPPPPPPPPMLWCVPAAPVPPCDDRCRSV